jgi:phosphoribosylglycinamide formyltransferase-1
MGKKRIAMFISGRGSNFMSIHERILHGEINGEISLVLSDNPDAQGLGYASQRGIPYKVFPWKPPRADYFQGIIDYLENRGIDLIVLAGFMRVLSPNIISRYKHRILNIHPALLPSFPGEHAQHQAFEYGVKFTGCTVHFVDEGIDTGPIIEQRVVPVLEQDDAGVLAERILKQEHEIFPEVVKLFCNDKLKVTGRKVHKQTNIDKEEKLCDYRKHIER